jgi:hypothetical protein
LVRFIRPPNSLQETLRDPEGREHPQTGPLAPPTV